MKIKLLKKGIFEGIPSMEELSDSSLLDSLDVINKLKALATSLDDGFIEAEVKKDYVFSFEFETYFEEDEYEIIN